MEVSWEIPVLRENVAVIKKLDADTYYFSIATVDSDGVQGSYTAQLEQVVL